MGSSFVGLPRDGTTGTDRDGLRRLWLGGGDRAARPDSTRLSSVPVPGLRPVRSDGILNRASLPSDIIGFAVFCRLRYRLTLRDLSEIMLLRGFTVSHESIRRWEAKLLPAMGEALRKRRHGIGRSSGQSWYADETYLKVHGRWCYLYRAIDRDGNLTTLGRDVRHRTSIYLNNRLEQDHRGIKGRIRCMRGFKEHEAADRFCREYDELRSFLRSRSRHNQYVPATRRRRHFLHHARIAIGIMQSG